MSNLHAVDAAHRDPFPRCPHLDTCTAREHHTSVSLDSSVRFHRIHVDSSRRNVRLSFLSDHFGRISRTEKNLPSITFKWVVSNADIQRLTLLSFSSSYLEKYHGRLRWMNHQLSLTAAIPKTRSKFPSFLSLLSTMQRSCDLHLTR